ncbi:BLUF domain-containing protein [Methylobacterium sp. W2]|uniref:BLUF domain-containing protein n=1 Tax=Methylobacterium sp. W2 TaxID=2598107 RepID=UPI001D0C7057|nr:BLUF domain-containing protein [Methylobacterium sp. W2]MCC0806686.1 BLUF domain-containing protein [Methylobacterium sp. W2]
MPLSQIVFYSRNLVKLTGGSMRDMVRDILASCSRYDRASGMTGALVFNEDFFLQAMEGESSTISEQLWNLAADSRHSGMVLVSAAPVQQRSLGGWTVGYAGRSEVLNALYLQYGPTAKFDPTEMSAAAIIALLRAFTELDASHFVQRSGQPGIVAIKPVAR